MAPRRARLMKNIGYEDIESAPEKSVPLSDLRVLLIPYFWPRPWLLRLRTFVSLTLVIASRSFNVLSPLFLKMATDQLVNNGIVPLQATLCYCGSLFLSNGARQLYVYLYLAVKQNAGKEVSANLFTHLHKMSMHFHLTKKTGKIMRVLDRGIDSTDSVVNVLFFRFIPTILEVIAVSLVFLFAFQEKLLSIVCLVSVIVYTVVTFVGTNVRLKFKKQSNKHDNDANEKAVDSLTNFETVKYFGAEQYEVDRYMVSIGQYQLSSYLTRGFLNCLNVSQQFVQTTCLFLCMYITAVKINQGVLSVGDFVAVGSYINNIFKPLDSLGSIYNTIVQSVVDMSNLVEILLEEPDIVDKEDAKDLVLAETQSTVTFDHVGFTYPGQPASNGLKNVCLTIPKGQTLAVVGPTGAGKSTLSRLLFRFYDVTAGRVLVDGQDISLVKQHSLRKSLGIVPQDAVMFNETIYYNIRYGRHDATDADVEAAAKSAQLYDFVMTLPDRFQTKVGERGLKLSGGEKQRVAIARAILKNPQIMILDEATSALDTLTERSIYESLVSICANRTTLVIAHRLSTIRDAHQIAVLDKGEVLELGSHDQLIAKNGVYCSMWNQQCASGEIAPDVDV
ncbi:Aste57867_24351 [Aphanomyces stellatus]|uniref:Aste57867_24351 protein n=1 Tax=Aphanomyces stellatus TaxID=120398 RepID=A0A485LUJ5_9STRA|nr:hypothetical protein As57867_024275 [Aphanomyces stellatus]VFU00991.1 Aste57867_24351 [Aphanomyces stellatus]